VPLPASTIRWTLVVSCAVLAVWFGMAARDQGRTRDAADRALAGDVTGAAGAAARVDGRPAALRARVVRARSLFFAGDLEGASAAYRSAAGLAPNDWTIRREWAVTEARRGAASAARRQLARALALNPRMDVPAELLRPAATG
jgi:Flp pilus assembly protein TadD